jgi:broad specificity phosphatase PhoE
VRGTLVHYLTVRDLLIIRHGESEWNLEHRWQGWKNAPLTPLGEKQARERAELLADAGFSPAVVHCSDLGRARDTAEIVADALSAEVRSHRGLRERGGGEWEGHTSDEIDVKWPGLRMAWRRGELTGPPGGEDDDTVFTRFDAAITSVIDAGTPTLVVTHGGVLRLVATRAGVPEAALLPNLGGYWFDVQRGVLANPEPIPPLLSSTELPVAE